MPRGVYNRTRRESSLPSVRSSAHDGPGRKAKASTTEVVKEATQKTLRLVDDVRRPFLAFVEDHEVFMQTRADLAPRFMKAFNAWAAETGSTFVAFVRLFDPDVPEKTVDYKRNRTYAAADYLRRLRSETAQQKKAIPASRRPVPPFEAIARLIATIIPAVDDSSVIFDAFVKELRWTEPMVKRLRRLLAEADTTPLHLARPHHPVRRIAA